ncbi:MAG TPA: cytochrome c oxidase subunit II [Blastocatellia bacterium]|nr:cytochrome c oxidase subunit II [Blastocatellia bacterium]
MGRILGALIFILTIVSIIIFAGGFWPAPPFDAAGHAVAPTNAMGRAIDAQFARTMIVVGIAFILAQVALGYILFRFGGGKKGEKAMYTHGNNRLEVIWTIVTAVVFVTLGVMAQKVWAELHLTAPPADAIEWEVTGQQFEWNFHNAGPDKQMGPLNMKLWSDQANFGVDDNDSRSKDDIVSKQMVVPVNHPVKVTLRSKDVIHSFFIPAFRLKQDAVPGMTIVIHFTPEKIGEYDIACAELCGMFHYKMPSKLRVVSDQDYQDWLTKNAGNH